MMWNGELLSVYNCVDYCYNIGTIVNGDIKYDEDRTDSQDDRIK